MRLIAGDLSGAVTLTLLFLLLLAVTEYWTRRFNPAPELSRKVVHIAGGMLCVLFPLFLNSTAVVFIMTSVMSLLFLLGAKPGGLSSLNRVSRKSYGSEYYPLAVFLVFVLSGDTFWIYAASILVLACADAGAALVGSKYGSIHYTVDEEKKSLEGSLVFLVLAFCCTLLPLATLSPLSIEIALFSSLLVAIVVTGIEAISRNGRDNLFVPIAVCLILPKISSKPVSEIIYQNVSLAALFLGLSFLVWKSRSMNVGGAITVILFFYACWSLGSELWALPLFGSFLIFYFSWRYAANRGADDYVLRVPVAAQALTPPLLILLAANFFDLYNILFAPFVAVVMQITHSFIWAHVITTSEKKFVGFGVIHVLLYGLLTWTLVSLPAWYFQHSPDVLLLLMMFPVAMTFSFISRHLRLKFLMDPVYSWNKKYRTWTTLGAGLTILLLQYAGFSHWELMPLFVP